MGAIAQVSTGDYQQMIEDQRLLRALQANGVDNWIGYQDALNSLEDQP